MIPTCLSIYNVNFHSLKPNRTFREMSKAEEQLSLCKQLCEDLADDLKKEDLKVGSSVLIVGLILPVPTEESKVMV